jgi:hypothetical protein
MLAFTSVYFFGINLFNTLRANQTKKFPARCFLVVYNRKFDRQGPRLAEFVPGPARTDMYSTSTEIRKVVCYFE